MIRHAVISLTPALWWPYDIFIIFLIGNWQGYFIDKREFIGKASGRKWLINVIMDFQSGNQFTAIGQDEVDPFTFVNGKISGKCHTKYR